MGKTRGHGSRRGAYRGGGGGRGKGRGEEEEESSEEEYGTNRGMGGQRATVGMLPPSDSEDEDGEEGEPKEKKAASKAAAKGGQSKTAGKLPPSGSEDEDDDEDGSDSEEESSEEPLNEYLASSAPRKKKQVEEEPDPEQIRKDIERLELIKQKREQDRLKRIETEGWDRFAPVSETNQPPGHVPSDHPSHKE